MIDRFTNMRALNTSLAEALNMIDPSIENHHQQTSYLAYMIARAAGFDEYALTLTRFAALTHDIGFITMEDPGRVEELESNAREIAEVGARLMEDFPNSTEAAEIVRYCQSSWREYLSAPKEKQEACRESARIASVIHLADAVSVMLRPDAPVLNQVKGIRNTVDSLRNIEFSPEAVDAFLRVSEHEFVWMDLRYNPQFLNYFVGETEPVSLDKTVELSSTTAAPSPPCTPQAWPPPPRPWPDFPAWTRTNAK